ncbi:aminodeoxychorismate synthase component I [Coprobacter sp.]
MHLFSQSNIIKELNNFGKSGKAFIFIINYSGDEAYIFDLSDIDPDFILYDFNGITNFTKTPENIPNPIIWDPQFTPFKKYHHSFSIVKENLLLGNSYLTNLTFPTLVKTNLSLKEIFEHNNAPYRLWIKDKLTVFSPEIFIRILHDNILSYPMKGTIDANIPDAKNLIINDPKECAEHATIVDLIRNDLSQIAENVHVSRYKYIDKITTNKGKILQVSSEIQGKLQISFPDKVGNIIYKLLPAGSITGAPKKKTIEIIHSAENYNRGFYTGIMGYCDNDSLESAVMIRFIEQQDKKMIFKSGGGITAQSDVYKEYNEMKQKVYVPIY